METLAGFIEIGQDAAAVIESGRTDVLGVFTGGIQTCMVTAFECQSGLVVVHDSAQLRFTDIAALLAKYGRCLRLTAVYPRSCLSEHADRLERLKRVTGLSGTRLRKVPVDSAAFALAFSTDGELRVFAHGSVSTDNPLPEKAVRTSITELNNFFIKPGSQSLALDVQFCEGSYNPIRALDKTPEQIMAIVAEQPRFFFNNAALLHAAHQLGVLVAPEMVDVVERYNLQRFRGEPVGPSDMARQASVFAEYLSAQNG